MTSNDIRKSFLDFFKSKGHTVVASSPLVPANDPTLLFTNAGMVQFKDVFLGRDKRDYTRAVSSQRCVRAGGKHNDLENVGYTARHHTFFEMLGNFSFGDYFKRDAILYSWELLTRVWKLPPEKLWVTVYHTDDEAYGHWLNDVGVPKERIVRIGDKPGGQKYQSDNFWQMADTGPCGPCSEIFYDHGADVAGGPPGSKDADGDRYIEVWNLVFMQFDRSADGVMTPLPKPCVDTGMGLERITAVLQHVHSNYEIDLFIKLIDAAAKATGAKDKASPSLRVIADHIRACAFLITDGVLPSNEGRGYVLRRIIRRAIRHGYKLGQEKPFFHTLVAALDHEMGSAYPELHKAAGHVDKVLLQEEQRFAETLTQGMGLLENAIKGLKTKTIPGETVFKLYDTYGFPADLTNDIARERGLTLDVAGFEREMDAQKNRARAASQFGAEYAQDVVIDSETKFTGYDSLKDQGKIVALFRGKDAVQKLSTGEQGMVVLDHTPFYAESGGQVGDHGLLKSGSNEFKVADTQKRGGGAHAHMGSVVKGELKIGDTLEAQVDAGLRAATVLNHSATHLLHAALRMVLGTHVAQKGSLVAPDRLRFDFSHYQAVTPAELQRIEDLVNTEVRRNEAADVREMGYDEAIKSGAMALFGEKYGKLVRVMKFGDFSTELCGGTHVHRTGDIGLFKIVSEGGVAAGVRRIEAVTGAGALAYVRGLEGVLREAEELLRAGKDEVVSKTQQLLERNKQLEKQLAQMSGKLAANRGDELLSQAVAVGSAKLLAAELDGVDAAALRDLLDQLKNKLGSAVIVLGAANEGKVSLIAGVTADLTSKVKAGELVNMVAQQVGGKGGGRPDMAQAGGTEPAKLGAALKSVPEWVRAKLG
ncbi:MAG TPA: alanine--tRNA ligase [Gammaproteobacteria bacterium]|nr:alanine--tRNA ligase [Gammaproteobacteria bacterium]